MIQHNDLTSDFPIDGSHSRRACLMDAVQRNEAENNPEYSFNSHGAYVGVRVCVLVSCERFPVRSLCLEP